MPYVITTNTGCDDAECSPNCRNRKRTRCAVATLEEARGEVQEAWRKVAKRPTPLRSAIQRMVPESGGTIGPLPDGTVIEVERVESGELARALPEDVLRAKAGGWNVAEIIDAYNVKQPA